MSDFERWDQKYDGNSVVDHLKETGPSSAHDLPRQPGWKDRRRGVRTFEITTRGNSSTGLVGTRKSAVYYLKNEHSKDEVLRCWADVNQRQVKKASIWALYHNCPEGFRETFKMRFDLNRSQLNPNYEEDGETANGGECPLCGSAFERTLSYHLQDGCGGA